MRIITTLPTEIDISTENTAKVINTGYTTTQGHLLNTTNMDSNATHRNNQNSHVDSADTERLEVSQRVFERAALGQNIFVLLRVGVEGLDLKRNLV